jgi:RNA polymerase sigma-70 factor (ECF subfamily)
VLYLIFNEGYTASGGSQLQRAELTSEAIRLARMLRSAAPKDTECGGLLALMLLIDARRAARADAAGDLVPLDRQDRSLWSKEQIAEGIELVSASLGRGPVGPYQLQAAIAALHVEAPSADRTDWAQIAGLYAALARVTASPTVAVNRAVAVAFASGPQAGLALLAPLLGDPALARYQPLQAAHAELLRRAGDEAGAARAYERAIELSANSVERAELARRLGELGR